jgi:N-acyl-D-amino-acid deacylase
MPDFVIKNGLVITGTGEKGFKADVVIEGERITAVERSVTEAPNGCDVIDATGKVVCPGMIDSHSHADMTIHRSDHPAILEPLIRQGITTFVGGNCGMAMAPLSRKHFAEVKIYLEGFTARELDGDVTWSDTAGFMERVEKGGLAVNCALLAPHGLMRIDEMGMAARYATEDEIDGMKRSLEECMDAGCIGMSTGLQYMPGLQSNTHELIELGRVLKKYDGIFTSHLRSYMNEMPRAVDEVAAVARIAEIRGQVSHIFHVPDLGPIGPAFRAVARALISLSK